ncbi:hypothetical protein HPB50_004440 [Hyalomma asiaticum]|uniref:Uncharacterized protein n=1 Tax=Hyalomma asiaticum TaxID=266040 RepID=A0ACB7TCI6_HYAAI|nr:hypothetical protein HPB50_004440 [Hyalomma asiaticum]
MAYKLLQQLASQRRVEGRRKGHLGRRGAIADSVIASGCTMEAKPRHPDLTPGCGVRGERRREPKAPLVGAAQRAV